MAYDPVAFKKTKHILRAAQFLRDLVLREVVHCAHVPGRVMIADILTKPVSRAVFVHLLSLLDAYSEQGVAHVQPNAAGAYPMGHPSSPDALPGDVDDYDV